VRCYEKILDKYPEQTTTLSLLNLAMRMAGPREAVWHALIRKNFGCTHFIVGRDHAGPGKAPDGTPYYGPYEAQELYAKHEKEMDISLVPFQQMVYAEDLAQYVPVDKTTPEMKIKTLTGTEFRRRLSEGLEIPEWFSYPEIISELKKMYPPRHQQGVTLFFTGLSGSGKSTIANALLVKLLELGGRKVTLLDGDLVRKNLSSELGFSKEHRNLNIERIGYVASEITKHGGIAVCAPIAPYRATRRKVRQMVEAVGCFVLIYVNTPLEVCEKRDRKGLYAKARAGIIKEFTGIDDPYEEPETAEIIIDTEKLTPELAAHRIIVKLENIGLIK
jgi:sulfate adenylyltransferase